MDTVDLAGGTIHYETAGPSTGRPVVFIHGYAMGGSLWRPLSARLARHGLRCIVPTWPLGAHQQAMRPSADMTMRGVAAMVLTSCDAFEHFPPPILAPFITAARVPVLFRVAVQAMRARSVRRRAYGALAHSDLDALTAEWTRQAVRDRAIAEDLRRFTGSLNRQTTLDAAARLPGFTKPALIAWSADDAFFPQSDGRRLADALPYSRLEVIENARTFSMLDAPDVLAGLIAEFATATNTVGRGAEADRC
jgi:pimeloyl-ACP methyl ester carboxylesterase